MGSHLLYYLCFGRQPRLSATEMCGVRDVLIPPLFWSIRTTLCFMNIRGGRTNKGLLETLSLSLSLLCCFHIAELILLCCIYMMILKRQKYYVGLSIGLRFLPCWLPSISFWAKTHNFVLFTSTFPLLLPSQWYSALIVVCWSYSLINIYGCPPNLWQYWLPGFFSASGGLSPWFHPGWLPPISLWGIGRLC